MASKKSQKRRASDDPWIQKAGAKCECTGQCGHNHGWAPADRAQRCGAYHGTNVVRKKDNPSSWVLAHLQGLTDAMIDQGLGPRTHAPGKYVTQGHTSGFGKPVYEELYDMQRITQIWLSVQEVNGHKLVFCQFCARHFRETRNLP